MSAVRRFLFIFRPEPLYVAYKKYTLSLHAGGEGVPQIFMIFPEIKTAGNLMQGAAIAFIRSLEACCSSHA
ncbi:MAG: hypothetical protein M0Z60_12150, partial [Nitrospiraceae bacterium]|nr:hypothetical protein [Nitrospiraceae bacterium]